MARKRRGLQPRQLPRCDGFDGDPSTGSPAAGTFRSCTALATYRVEWSSSHPLPVEPGTTATTYYLIKSELVHEQSLSCDRHLADLVDRADRDQAFAMAPYLWPRVEALPPPTVVKLDFELDKRARAHGRTEYLPVETNQTGPVTLTLF
jgi:hypothetical protein